LKDINYVLRKSELAVVNHRSGVEQVYRPSEIVDIEAFKVPFGYQLRFYRAGESREHMFRIFGVRIFAGEYGHVPEEKGVLVLRDEDEMTEILSRFRST
jgi:hypothetical protein